MKTNKLIAILALGTVLSITPAFAQGRGGGSRGGGHSSSSSSRGGASHSSSSSSSRSSSSFSSSSSRSSSSYSGSSRSSNRGSSFSSSPRSNSSYSGSNRGTSVTRPSSGSRSGSTTYRGNSAGNDRGTYSNSRSSIGAPRSTSPSDRSYNSALRGRDNERPSRGGAVDNGRGRGNDTPNAGGRGGRPGTPSTQGTPGTPGGPITAGRGTVHRQDNPGHTFARPGHPGPMPPSHRPMHPAPYFHHPYHHGIIHMRPVFWHPVPPRPIFWPGFWVYCNSYWYDYHVTDVVVVHKYVHDTYNVDLVSYAVSGDIMYAIVNDVDGNTYLQVFDQNDKMLAEQKISSRYIKTEIDRDNGGCWIFKKRDKDPMLFLYTGGELLIYEAD